MDTSAQVYEVDATGWQRGLYDDVRATFRAPIVNWIFRTTMANYPEFLRYAWSQVKPIFETRSFASFSIRYRDSVLSAVEDGPNQVPVYRRSDVDVSPAEFAELRGQLATFDVVAPRLAMLFEVMDRGLHVEPLGQQPATERASTAPFPDWLDADRGRAPTMLPFDDVPDEAADTVTAIQGFHGIDEGLPSIYRCLAQWPGYLVRAWEDLEPVLDGDGFDEAVAEATDVVADHVEGVPYSPRLSPDDLRARGFDDSVIEDVQDLFREFNTGAIETVIPALPVYARTLDVEGEPRPL